MAKDFEASVDTQVAAAKQRPIMLFEIELDSGTLRYAGVKSNLVFPTGGNTYYAKDIELENIRFKSDDQLLQFTAKLDNVSRDMSGYNNAEKFEGKRFIAKRIWLDALGNASYYNELLYGDMKEPTTLDYHWMIVDIVMGSRLETKILQDYFQNKCNHRFGDSKCNRDGYADLTSLTASGTADSGSESTLVDDALTQVDDYWNHGSIEITKSGIVYKREILDFDQGTHTLTFDVELPVAIAGSETYTVKKGCSQTWNVCQSNEAYGPSSDNKANFFGFFHIGNQVV